jgi:hypothetical protein
MTFTPLGEETNFDLGFVLEPPRLNDSDRKSA